MLEGTELSFAYTSMMGDDLTGMGGGSGAGFNVAGDLDINQIVPRKEPSPQAVSRPVRAEPENPIVQQVAAIQNYPTPMQQAPRKPQPPKGPQYDPSSFNRQFEQEQKIAVLVNELKKQKAREYQYAAPVEPEEGYWDRMAGKKKELFKFVQSGLIILFAISLHFIIDFLLKQYLQSNDVSYNREVLIRVLYPVGVLFIAWNIIAFMKGA